MAFASLQGRHSMGTARIRILRSYGQDAIGGLRVGFLRAKCLVLSGAYCCTLERHSVELVSKSKHGISWVTHMGREELIRARALLDMANWHPNEAGRTKSFFFTPRTPLR